MEGGVRRRKRRGKRREGERQRERDKTAKVMHRLLNSSGAELRQCGYIQLVEDADQKKTHTIRVQRLAHELEMPEEPRRTLECFNPIP